MTTTIDVPALQPHPGQQRIVEEASRFNVLACGRRWGKTDFGVDLCIDLAAEGHPVGWFAPNYKFLEDAWNVMYQTLEPAYGKHLRANKSERRMQLAGGGVVEFWSTQPAQAGDDESMVARGRKYKRIVYDEAAHARRLKADWTRAIRATLSDYRGDAWFFSTPKGQNYFHRLWVRGQTGEDDWASWQMPTAMNPFIHPDEIEAARRDMPADAFSQEYEAEFLADAANPFGVDAIRACTRDAVGEGKVAVWGVDLAKSTDWTVAIGLDHSGNVVAYQRYQKDWRNTSTHLIAMIGHTPALVDSTGVGDPIVEFLQARCPCVEGYKFTAQSKQPLMEGLALAIQRGAVTFPDGLIRHELEMFQYEYTASGVRYTAPEGEHDDCVDALALAVRCLQVRPATVSLDIGPTFDDDEDAYFDGSYIDDPRMWNQG
jgi:hypothetical protein